MKQENSGFLIILLAESLKFKTLNIKPSHSVLVMALSCQECPVSSMPSTLTPTRTLRRLLAVGMEGVQIKLGMVVVEEEGGLVLEGDWVAVLLLGEGGGAKYNRILCYDYNLGDDRGLKATKQSEARN